MKKMLALLCAAILLLTYVATAIAAEAVSPLANCAHANSRVDTYKSDYKAIDTSKHQYVPTKVYMCYDCGTVFWTHVEPVATEKHSFNSNGTCKCGAQITIPIPDYPVPGGN